MSCTPYKKLQKTPYLAVYAKFQLPYTTTSNTGSQPLLASTSSKVLSGRGSEKAFSECLRVSDAFLSATKAQL